jgi:hypothetical protein
VNVVCLSPGLCAEWRCSQIGKSGRQCRCRITRDERHYFEKDSRGFFLCLACVHSLGLHPGPQIGASPPPVKHLSFTPSSSSPTTAAAAALASIGGGTDKGAAAAAAAAADVAHVQVLAPINDEMRKHFQQLDSRNTAHGERRVDTGNPTRVQLTIMSYDLKEPLLTAFVDHLKVSKAKQPEQVRDC